MKLLTQKTVTNHVFRERLRDALSKQIHGSVFRSKNPNSVDGQECVSRAEFLSVPHITKIRQFDQCEAQLDGNIQVELTLETRVHGTDHAEPVFDISVKRCRFTIDIEGEPRKDGVTDNDIQKLKLKLCQLLFE